MNRAEAKAEARRLFTAEGYTLAAAAEAVGVPVSTVEKWSSAEGWGVERETKASYATTVRALKVKLLERAVVAADDPKVTGDEAIKFTSAWKQAEAAWPEHRYTAPKEDPKARAALALELLGELVDFLEKADRNALAVLGPHIAAFGQTYEATLGGR